MSAYEGSKMQENDEKRNQGFLGHIKEAKQGRKEVEKELDLVDKGLREIYYKASKLEYDDFKGWLKGEGYQIIRREL